MIDISVLDCTLRDGGYVNNWRFGESSIQSIVEDLTKASIDIVEVGFIKNCKYNADISLFPDVQTVKFILPNDYDHKKIIYVGMIALGEDEPDINKIMECDHSSITGIRLSFNKQDCERAVKYIEKLIRKGYKVFVQPICTMLYSDADLIALIEQINKLTPYAFYIVDTLGAMQPNDMTRMAYFIDGILKSEIRLGFHSHNNLQLSFANVKEFMSLPIKRKAIIDSSIMGIGRSAGNLCTELIVDYINTQTESRYQIHPIIGIIDQYMSDIMANFSWGYRIEYYLSAINKCHPNYAAFLINENISSVNAIEKILFSIPEEKRVIFDEEYIKQTVSKAMKFDVF